MELLRADPATAPHGGRVLVIDDSGDRKDGTKTAHVGRQYLGRYGKTGNGIVTVTTVWADERIYYPVHAAAVHPGAALREWEERPGVPDQAGGSARIWRSGRRRRGSCSARWSRTARTGTRTGSAASWPGPGCRS